MASQTSLQLKRTSVSGRSPNTSILDTGELALNLADGILYSTNGTVVFEIGANTTSSSTDNLTLRSRGSVNFNDSDNSNKVELRAPTTVSANIAFTLPGADGSNGQVITTDGSGNLSFADASGGISNIVEDTTPQLGGNLDGQSFDISTSGSLIVESNGPSGAASVALKASIADPGEVGDYTLYLPTSVGSNGQVLTTDGAGNLSFVDAAGGGLQNVVEDTTPQLGGNLDVNNNTIVNGGGNKVKLQANPASYVTVVDLSGVDKILFDETGGIEALGGSHRFGGTATTRGVVNIIGSTQGDAGSGALRIHDNDSSAHVELTAPTTVSANVSFTLPGADGSNGQVLTTDGSGNLSFADAGGGGGTFETLFCSTAYGYSVVDCNNTYSLSNGFYGPGGNFFVGQYAGVNTNGTSGGGSYNNFLGNRAGYCNTTGSRNNFMGSFVGFDNTTGSNNNFFGTGVGRFNTTGSYNNFIGASAGRFNTTGSRNNFFGNQAGYCNTTGSCNNFFGNEAGNRNTTGSCNNFMGIYAGFRNTTGCNNNFLGNRAGLCNTTGINNNFIGTCAGYYNTTGSCNTYLGGFLGSGFATCSNHVFLSDGAGNRRIEFNNSGSLGVAGANFGTAGQVLTSCGNAAAPVWADAGGGGISNVVEDTTPQLGGNLDLNNNYIGHPNANMKAYDFGTGSQFEINMQGYTALSIYANPGSSIANITINDDLEVQGGDITLGGTGRIQGIDTVSADTDAANKLYVDNAVAGAGGGGTFETLTCSGCNPYNVVDTNNTYAFTCSFGGPGGNFFVGKNAGINTDGDGVGGGLHNNFIGAYAGCCNTTGSINNFIGASAGRFNTTGNRNNFFGYFAGYGNTTGCNNNFMGNQAGRCNTTGTNNNFFGTYAGQNNTTGSYNNFMGNKAGYCNTTGSCNNFIGFLAGCSNTTGTRNNFIGQFAGLSTTTGTQNNFMGAYAGRCNTTGSRNNFMGRSAGQENTTGSRNTFMGVYAGALNTTGSCNTYLGAFNGNGFATCSNHVFISDGAGNRRIEFNNSGAAGFAGANFGTAGQVLTSCGNAAAPVWADAAGGGGGTFETLTCSTLCGYNVVDCNNTYSFVNGTYGPGSNFFVGQNAGVNTNGTFGQGSFNNFMGRFAGYCNTTGNNNNFMGTCAGYCNTTGNNNNFIGSQAGRSNTTGTNNNFFGNVAGRCNTSGTNNNFFGGFAGYCNTTGGCNNFMGSCAGCCNTTGFQNNFFGLVAGRFNTTGCNNNFFGAFAGCRNTSGSFNNFFGISAGRFNTSGKNNNFFGFYAGYCNTTGGCNNFIGTSAGRFNTTGLHNNFFGNVAGYCNTTGSDNNFIGRSAGYYNTTGCNNNFFGALAGYRNTTGIRNNFFGNSAGLCNTTGSCNTYLGGFSGDGFATCSNHVFISDGAGNRRIEFNNSGSLGVAGANFGTAGQVLTSCGNAAAPVWADAAGGGGGGTFETLTCSLNYGYNVVDCNNTYSFVGGYYGPGSNFFVGQNAGINTNGTYSQGSYNNFIGRSAGCCNTTGSCNNFMGKSTGRFNTTGYNNNFFGNSAGYCNTTGNNNNFMGNNAGICNTTGSHNNFFGCSAGRFNTTGSLNNYMGRCAGYCNTTGSFNNFIGAYAGFNTTGSCNNFIGRNAGFNNTTGIRNNFFGDFAGYYHTTGSCNTYLGGFSGSGFATCSNYVHFSDGAGNHRGMFDNTGDFHSDGDVIAYSTSVSDERLKKDISIVTGALSKIRQINGVEFTMKDDESRRAGVIAQEVEKVFPVAVTEKKLMNHETYKTVRYDALHALLIEAVKELADAVEKLSENK